MNGCFLKCSIGIEYVSILVIISINVMFVVIDFCVSSYVMKGMIVMMFVYIIVW